MSNSKTNVKREDSPEHDPVGQANLFYRLASPGRQPPQAPQAPAPQAQIGGPARPAKKKAAAKKPAAERDWNYTYMPPDPEQRKKNGRVEGRNLITWNRKTFPDPLPVITDPYF